MTSSRSSTIVLATTSIMAFNTQSAPLTPTLFGTDGIRATVGQPPLVINDLVRLGYALGAWIHHRYGAHATIALGGDTRASGSLVKSALQTGLLVHGITIEDIGTLPTPALYYAVCKGSRKYACGIMISASHNPYQDNGIKIIDGQRGKLTHDDEQAISTFFHTYDTQHVSYRELGSVTYNPACAQLYIDTLVNSFPQNFLQGMTIVLDCAHGAATTIAPTIFERCGAQVIAINTTPTGYNINDGCGALYPATLAQAVVAHHAQIGFAFDGDADRVVAINHAGAYKDGDDLLAVLLCHPLYQKTPAIVGTVMTNRGLECFLAAHGKQLIRAQVGDKYVKQQLEQYALPLGGEQSGHIIIGDYLDTGDGIFTALRILETIKLTNNTDLHSFTRYPQVLINIPVHTKKDLAGSVLAPLIGSWEQKLLSGRLLVRYSGTENLLRIMVEDETHDHAQLIAQGLAHELSQELG